MRPGGSRQTCLVHSGASPLVALPACEAPPQDTSVAIATSKPANLSTTVGRPRNLRLGSWSRDLGARSSIGPIFIYMSDSSRACHRCRNRPERLCPHGRSPARRGRSSGTARTPPTRSPTSSRWPDNWPPTAPRTRPDAPTRPRPEVSTHAKNMNAEHRSVDPVGRRDRYVPGPAGILGGSRRTERRIGPVPDRGGAAPVAPRRIILYRVRGSAVKTRPRARLASAQVPLDGQPYRPNPASRFGPGQTLWAAPVFREDRSTGSGFSMPNPCVVAGPASDGEMGPQM